MWVFSHSQSVRLVTDSHVVLFCESAFHVDCRGAVLPSLVNSTVRIYNTSEVSRNFPRSFEEEFGGKITFVDLSSGRDIIIVVDWSEGQFDLTKSPIILQFFQLCEFFQIFFMNLGLKNQIGLWNLLKRSQGYLIPFHSTFWASKIW